MGDFLVFNESNFDEAKPLANEKSTILGVIITFMTLSWICVIARLYTRLVVVRKPGWDDLFALLYLVFATTGNVAASISTNHGLGEHLLKLDDNTLKTFLKLFYILSASYITSTALIKLSLLFQYLRVFPRGTSTHASCAGLLVFVAIWGFTYTFVAWFPCFPISQYWLSKPNGRCYGFGAGNADSLVIAFEIHTAMNMILDIIILAIPIPLFFKKDTPKNTKLGLIFLLIMGALVSVFAAWRLKSIIEHKAATFPVFDLSWYGPTSLLAAELEVAFASICASVPIFWPVLKISLGQIFVTKEFAVTNETREESDAHSRVGSETELRPGSSEKEFYYGGDFGVPHALSWTHAVGVEAGAKDGSENLKDKKGWRRFFAV